MNLAQCQICLDIKDRLCLRLYVCIVCKNRLLICSYCYLDTSIKNIYYCEKPSQRVHKYDIDKSVHLCSINCFLNYERNDVIEPNSLMMEHQANLLQLSYSSTIRVLLNTGTNLIKDLNEIIVDFLQEIQK